jgi:hypothetical protein
VIALSGGLLAAMLAAGLVGREALALLGRPGPAWIRPAFDVGLAVSGALFLITVGLHLRSLA